MRINFSLYFLLSILIFFIQLSYADNGYGNNNFDFDINNGNNGEETRLLICRYTDTQGKINNSIRVADNGYWARYRFIHPFTALDATFISNESYQTIINKCKNRIPPGGILTDIVTTPQLALKKIVNPNIINFLITHRLDKMLFSHDVYFSRLGYKTEYPFHRIVFFGDSLSDSSDDFRYYAYLMQRAFPGIYWNNRFSNGLMWGDWLASSNKTINGTGMNLPDENFAWGGAYSFENRSGIIPSLIAQIGTYLDFINSNDLNTDEGDTLFSILVGGNDFLTTSHTPLQVANAVEKEIERLIDSAQNHHLSTIYFLVPTLPDVSIVPNEAAVKNRAEIHENVLEYNTLMNENLKNIQQKYSNTSHHPIKVVIFRPDFADNLNHLVNLAHNPFNHLDFKHSCMTFGSSGLKTCKKPQDTIFWDGLHPNSTAGCMLGQNVTNFIENQLQLPLTYFNTDFKIAFVNQCRYTYILNQNFSG